MHSANLAASFGIFFKAVGVSTREEGQTSDNIALTSSVWHTKTPEYGRSDGGRPQEFLDGMARAPRRARQRAGCLENCVGVRSACRDFWSHLAGLFIVASGSSPLDHQTHH